MNAFSHPRFRIHQLVEALAEGRCCAFVGAGASAESGVPLWNELLAKGIDFAEHRGWDMELPKARLKSGEHLLAAELLQYRLGNELYEFISSAISSATVPSQIHSMIARLPFRAIITTNFDTLLERALNHKIDPFTWKDSTEVFSAVTKAQPFLWKIHGDIRLPQSLVLTLTHFREQIHGAALNRDSLSVLLSTTRMLFIGHSLRDSDLLFTMDELRMRYGDAFGPHFALLFRDEVDDAYCEHMLRHYNIVVLPVPLTPDASPIENRGTVIASFLKSIDGQVSSYRQRNATIPNFHGTLFNCREVMSDLLDLAIEYTSSSGGSISMTHRVGDRRLKIVAQRSIEPNPREKHGNATPLTRDSHIRGVFLSGDRRRDWLLLDDTDLAFESLQGNGYGESEYDRRDRHARSELLVPIHADGNRAGVLQLTALVPNVYTKQHIETAIRMSEYIGWAIYETRQRSSSSARLNSFARGPREVQIFRDLLYEDGLLRIAGLRIIIYRVDYIDGVMAAVGDHESIEDSVSFNCDQHSLATRVLLGRRMEVIDNVREEFFSDEPRLDLKAAKRLGITDGPLVAIPVKAWEHTASILVAWSDKPGTTTRFKKLWELVPRRLERMANLMPIAPPRAHPEAHATATISL